MKKILVFIIILFGIIGFYNSTLAINQYSTTLSDDYVTRIDTLIDTKIESKQSEYTTEKYRGYLNSLLSKLNLLKVHYEVNTYLETSKKELILNIIGYLIYEVDVLKVNVGEVDIFGELGILIDEGDGGSTSGGSTSGGSTSGGNTSGGSNTGGNTYNCPAQVIDGYSIPGGNHYNSKMITKYNGTIEFRQDFRCDSEHSGWYKRGLETSLGVTSGGDVSGYTTGGNTTGLSTTGGNTTGGNTTGCIALTINGYSIPSGSYGSVKSRTKHIDLSNGNKELIQDFKCDNIHNGWYKRGDERTNIICYSGFTKSGNSCIVTISETENKVRELYIKIFNNHSPDSVGLEYWKADYDERGQTFAQIEYSMYTIKYEQIVNRLFNELLKRNASTGLSGYVSLLRSGNTETFIINGIKNSSEYKIRQLYLTILKREPDNSGLNHWMGELDGNIKTLSEIEAVFIAVKNSQ